MILILTTCPADQAESIGRALVEERLAACASALPGVRSVYFWEGKLETAGETLLLLKTRDDLSEALAKRLREIHPYEVPEVLVLPVKDGNLDYARWVETETRQSPSSKPK
jgi:periplasmic divalent cation tolerance protein